MAKGIRIRRPDGSVVLDTTTPITFVIGSVTTGAGINGSLVIPDVGAERYFAYINGVISNGNTPGGGYAAEGSALPAIKVSGRELSWKFPDGDEPATKRANVVITYAGYSL